MRNPTAYLKMRVLGAIDMAEGKTIRDRIKAVSQMTFTDEDGQPRQFTWKTISTWLCRYQKHGVTVMENKTRSDKGKVRKVPLEDVAEAVHKDIAASLKFARVWGVETFDGQRVTRDYVVQDGDVIELHI